MQTVAANDIPSTVGRLVPCLLALRALYPTLTEAERRAADWMLADPNLLLHSSITTVAAGAGVGVSTVSRLSAKLGYPSFPDLKLALAAELLNPERGVADRLEPTDDPATVAAKTLRAIAQNLIDTADLLDPAALEHAARALIAAGRIELYAVGLLSGSVARHAEARLRLLQKPCAAVTEQWEHGPCAALLGPGDVAVGLSYSGETEQVAQALHTAAQNGAVTIAVTKTPRSVVAASARIPLLIAPLEEGRWGDVVGSRIAMIGVIEALYANALLMRRRDAG